MNQDNNIQHPDITAAEETGYAWFPRQVRIEATEKHARDFCGENFEAFFNFVMAVSPYSIINYLDDNSEDFAEFVACGGTF